MVMHLLERFPPSGIQPDWGTDRFDSLAWHWGEPEPELANTTDLLRLSEHELTKMKRAHMGFVGALHNRLPRYVPHRYDDNTDGKNVVQSDSPRRGIVTVGGGKYYVILAVSLRFLRRSGTTLPIEVFVTESEYEQKVCEDVLPKLNAVCRVYPKMVDSKGKEKKVEGFQLKAFAMLFSSFDEVLYMDADNTAMQDVAPLFDSAPFRATGLVTWPDFWQTTVSPLYYDIASKNLELKTTPPPIMGRPSTESGQILVDKTRHWKTLLLAAYYNYYGPPFYYRLLNQGGTGMGDKETFLPAAAVFGLPAYQVHTPVEKVGHRFEDDSTGSRVMIQHDAGEDWEVTATLTNSLANSGSPPANEAEWKALYRDVRPVFLHLSWPKWDPTNLLGHVSKWSDMTMGIDGRPESAFHHPPELAVRIKGTERMLWEEARWVACLRDGKGEHVFGHYCNNKQADRACERLRGHFANVLDGDTGKMIGLGPEDVLYPAVREVEGE
ncbi:mannosyltransferase [Sporothrix stenoceras]|uniref:Mannosyltransferase n=1 Tax=Sporothrix stenoceras TaxID=5173 RepID=A0ABR3YV62_9PEZI